MVQKSTGYYLGIRRNRDFVILESDVNLVSSPEKEIFIELNPKGEEVGSSFRSKDLTTRAIF